jgi:hypothetical protein
VVRGLWGGGMDQVMCAGLEETDAHAGLKEKALENLVIG